MKILIVVDPQNDFVHPDGALSIKGAMNAVAPINALLASDYIDYKIITQDWHPQNHISFASTHGTEFFTMKQTYQGSKFISQVMWPNHCVQNTWGAEIFGEWKEPGDTGYCEAIKGHLAHAIMKKGYDSERECYSVFEYVHEGQAGYHDYTPHGIMLQQASAAPGNPLQEIIICGYATDYCVKQTAIAARLITRNKVTVIKDAIAAVNPEHGKQAIEDMMAVGIMIHDYKDYV